MYKRPECICHQESIFPISFHDTDAMGVIWHGNYFKFFELAREALFEKIGYGYPEMKEEGFSYPVTECTCRFRHSLSVTDKLLRIDALLTEYENRIIIHYEIYTGDGSKLCAYGKTQQVAVKSKSRELLFDTSSRFQDAVKKFAGASHEISD